MTNGAFPEIPNLSVLRKEKPGYDVRFGDIDTDHPLHNDRLVDPRDHGFAASSYYSRPNRMTGKVLPGVPDAPLLRADLVKRLLLANEFLLSSPRVRAALGESACLRIDDGLRPYQVQKFAFDVAWPMVIRRKHPELTSAEVAAEVSKYCAEPKTVTTATPHLTGGGVDVALVSAVTGRPFDRGHSGGAVKGTAFPDFHEGYHLTPGMSDIVDSPEQAAVSHETSVAVLSRRVLYHATTVVAGLYMNPHEIWHVSIGDPLSAYVATMLDDGGRQQAYYGIADPPQWYLDQMESLRQK